MDFIDALQRAGRLQILDKFTTCKAVVLIDNGAQAYKIGIDLFGALKLNNPVDGSTAGIGIAYRVFAVGDDTAFPCVLLLQAACFRAACPSYALRKLIDHLVLVNEGKEDTVNTGIRTKWTVKLLTKLAKECKDEIETEKARRVEIDMSALDRIRYEAAGTREKLITEEDLDVFPSDSHMEDSAPDEPKGSEGMEDISTYDLTADELRFLKMLISGEDIRILRSEGLILSVLADSVNEKLFDIFSDSVIEIGDVPCLIEDYIDDLRNMGIA